MAKVFKLWRVSRVILYLFVVTIAFVNWEVYLSYSNEEQFEILPIFEGGMVTILFILQVVLLILYNSYWIKIPNKYFVRVAILFRLLSTLVNGAVVNPSISDSRAKGYFAINAILLLPVVNAYLTIPAMMAFAKCVPHSLESIMIGSLNSMIKLNSEIICRLWSICYLIGDDVTKEDYGNLGKNIFLSASIQLGCLATVRFVFDRTEFRSLQNTLHNLPKMSKQEIDNLNLMDKQKVLKRKSGN